MTKTPDSYWINEIRQMRSSYLKQNQFADEASFVCYMELNKESKIPVDKFRKFYDIAINK